MNEITDKLPTSWELVKLGDFVENEKGKKPKRQKISKDPKFCFPYIDIKAFEKGVFKSYTDGDNCRFCSENDFLMVWDGSRSGLVGKGISGALGSTLVRINFPHIVNDYAYYFLKSKYLQINSRAKGSGTPHVDPDLLWNYNFPIPPSNEQARIVEKIEELFSELDKGIESLKTAREQLKVYRQALLKHAFEGKLTKQWRKDNADKLETTDQLLSRIQQEREIRYQQKLDEWKKTVDKWEAGGKEGRKPTKPKKARLVKSHDDYAGKKFNDLPASWCWWCVGENNVDVFDGPFGSNLKTSDYVDSGVRVIRLENISSLQFIDEKKSYITEEKYKLLKKHTVEAGDIIFSSFVTENIRVSLIPVQINKAINKADCFCIRIFGEMISNRYLVYFLSTRFVYKQIEDLIHGIGRPRINTSQLKGIRMPQCSPREQRQIVNLLDAQLSDVLKLGIV